MTSNALADYNIVPWDESKTPNVNVETFSKFYDRAVASGANACYSRVTKNNYHAHYDGCWGSFPSVSFKFSDGFMAAIKYRNQRNGGSKGVRAAEPTEAERFYVEKILFHRFSPWKALVKHLLPVRDVNKTIIGYILDGETNMKAVDRYLLMNFNLATRGPWESSFGSQYAGPIYEALKSEKINKREAFLLAHAANPRGTGNWVKVSSGFYSSFLANDYVQSWVKGVPNSKMAKNGTRFCSMTDHTGSTNDAYVWGDGGKTPKRSTLNNTLHSLVSKSGSTSKTAFGGTIHTITRDDVKKVLSDWRQAYQAELKLSETVADASA